MYLTWMALVKNPQSKTIFFVCIIDRTYFGNRSCSGPPERGRASG